MDEPSFCYDLLLQKAQTKKGAQADIERNSRFINKIGNETNEC